MGMFDMEKYRYKNVEPVCILNFASGALKSSNSVGVWTVMAAALPTQWLI